MTTATFIKDITGFTGAAKLYELSEPIEYGGSDKGTTRHVIVSATNAMFSGPETYIFPADKNGKIIDWGELEGSYRGGLNHHEAITGAGWSVG